MRQRIAKVSENTIAHIFSDETAEALDFESALFGLLASTDDMKEGMEAFLEKRKPDFKGR